MHAGDLRNPIPHSLRRLLFIAALLCSTAPRMYAGDVSGAPPIAGGDPRNGVGALEVNHLRLPIQFVANVGQWDAEVKYGVVRGMEKAAFTRDGVQLFRPMRRPSTFAVEEIPDLQSETSPGSMLERSTIHFVNPNPGMRMDAIGQTRTSTNFYSGNDSSRWFHDVPAYAGIRYRDVWRGIDVEYIESNDKLLQRIVIQEGADLERIAIVAGNLGSREFGISGARTRDAAPGTAEDAPSRTGDQLHWTGDTMHIVPYRPFFDRRRVIETEFNTYFGGNASEYVCGLDTDEDGRMYLYIVTASTDLPIRDGFQSRHAGGPLNIDCYVGCIEADNRTLRYGTYLGGSGDDFPQMRSNSTGFIIGGELMAIGKGHAAHLLCNPQSPDFPVTPGVIQEQRYNTISPNRLNCATSLIRLDSLGRLDAATWLGGPTWFGAYMLDTGPDGSVYVMGHASGRQWFVTKGTVQDTLRNVSRYGDAEEFVAVLVRISPRLDSVIAATYFFAPGGYADTTRGGVPPSMFMCVDHGGALVMGGRWTGSSMPLQNAWLDYGSYFLTKLTPDLSAYVFSTQLPGDDGSVEVGIIPHIDIQDNIILSGTARFTGIPMVNSMPGGDSVGVRYLIKFKPEGGIPIFSTYLPWDADGNSGIMALESNACGDIVLLGRLDSAVSPLLVRAEDTVPPLYWSHCLVRIDPLGQSISYGSYWHVDNSYLTLQGTWIGGLENLGPRHNGYFSSMDANNNLIFVSNGAGITTRNEIAPLNAFQANCGGASDLGIVRTRIPGCEIISCSMFISDSVVSNFWEHVLTAEPFEVTIEARNIDPERGATAVECVLILPPGLVLSPSSPSARQSLGARVLAPGEAATFTWRIVVDKKKLSGDGVWIDAVIYYKNAEDPYSGAPAASPCAYYLSTVCPEPKFICALQAPERLDAAPSGDAYTPIPFPVHFQLKNTGTTPFTIDRLGLYFGDGMNASAYPPGSMTRNGATLNPGDTFAVDWQADARRLGDERRISLFVKGWDVFGGITTYCEREITVAGLDPLRCEVMGTEDVAVNPRTGESDPVAPLSRLSVHHVLDSLIGNVMVTADLSHCRYLTLDTGTGPIQSISSLAKSATSTLDWPLRFAAIPSADTEDTLFFRISADNGRWTRECLHIISIRIVDAHLSCAIVAPDSLSEAEIEARTIFTLDYELSNVGTVPVDIDRLELTIAPTDAGLLTLDASTQSGGTLAPGGNIPWNVHLRAATLRAPRSATCTVTAFGLKDSILSVCSAVIEIPGIDGLRCAITTPDSVRFNRDSLRYAPNPVPVLLDLSNVLDNRETAIDAEIDLAGAPRFELATGETAQKSLAALDSHSTATLSWLLVPLKGASDETQTIRMRYRSSEQGDWMECGKSIAISAWPEIVESRCATGGHDSLFVDPEYERIIPEPFQVSYTATNSGTVGLSNCEAAIVLPSDFLLAGSDSVQSYGDLDPGQSATRWWTLKTSPDLSTLGPLAINWIWRSDEQGSSNGCARTMHIVPDPSNGIVVTPLHMYFEGELGSPPPPAQTITLWTGNGLAMPWTAQSDAWYIDLGPVAGDHAASIAVQPNTTILNKGMHKSVIEVAGVAPNMPKRIEVEYLIRSLTQSTPSPTPNAFVLGPVYPHPVALDGEARIMIDAHDGTSIRLLLYDLLGRERAVLHEGPLNGNEVLLPKPSSLGLAPGVYLIRLIGDKHGHSRLISVVQ